MSDLQGNGAPQAPQGQAAPEAGQTSSTVSLDDVNRAITARLRDYEKKVESKLSESFSSFESKLLETLQAQKAEGASDGKVTADSGKGPASIEDHPIVKSQQKQLSELKNKIAEAERLREAESQKARDAQMRNKLAEELGKHGIEGQRAKGAMALLVDADRRISAEADGTIVFRDANGDALDLQTGLKSWAASEDAKLYLPPRGAAGSGDLNRTTTNGTGRTNAPNDPKAALDQLVRERFFR